MTERFTSFENDRAADESEDLISLHTENLFDQNEDMAGEKVNLATGEPINNDGPTDYEELSVIDAAPHATGDALPPLPEEEDAAAKWLRENAGQS